MKDFIYCVKCMLSTRKYKDNKDYHENEYYWYRYLVLSYIKRFFSRFAFWKHDDDGIPF